MNISAVTLLISMLPVWGSALGQVDPARKKENQSVWRLMHSFLYKFLFRITSPAHFQDGSPPSLLSSKNEAPWLPTYDC